MGFPVARRAIEPQEARSFSDLILHGEVRAIASRVSDVAISLFKKLSCFFEKVVEFSSYLEYCLRMWFIPYSEREVIANLVSCVKSSVGSKEIIQELRLIPIEGREAVVNFFLPFFEQTKADYGFSIALAIRAIQHIPVEERAAVLHFSSLVLSSLKLEVTDLLEGVSLVTQEIWGVPVEEREAVVHLLLPFLSQREIMSWWGVSWWGVYGAINTIKYIPAGERETVVRLASSLIHQNMNIFEVSLIINQVRFIPAGQREAVVNRVERRIERGMRAMAIKEIIREELPENLRRENQFQAAARQGINVHEGNRDQRTREAIELLRERQGNISAERVALAKDEFINYLRSSSMDEDQKAYDALLKPREIGEVFGPLIGGPIFSVRGLNISGEVLIARLWTFASSLNGEEEENAKCAMILALRNSYEELGGRVCNQGKTQRLVISVLQGRLPGVHIDREEITVNQAVTIFCQANPQIQNLNELREAANQFCNDNPAVNKTGFMREIEIYARQEQME